MSESERRFTPGRVEVRAAAAEKRTIGGYAAKFNKPSQNLGGFIEVIDPAAFNRSKGNDWPDVLARYNHDDNMLLGTTGARTLRLGVDDTGLTYDVDPPQSRGDVYELVQRGDVNKSSFAFRVIGDDGDEWGLSDQNFPQRTLMSVSLVDVAPVNTPAYIDTSVDARALADIDKLSELQKEMSPLAALRSLAAKMHAPVEEVRRMAEANDLRPFFVRTDKRAQAGTFGPAARMALLNRAADPYA